MESLWDANLSDRSRCQEESIGGVDYNQHDPRRCHAWQDIGKNMKHGGDDESNKMMREECGARGDEDKGREEKRETCDQEEEAVQAQG